MLLRFLARAAGVLTLVFGLLTGVVVGSASACQCRSGEKEPQRYARASHVFTGVVTNKVYESQLSLRYTLQVGIEYKGDVPATVEVVTYGVETVCGLTHLQVGGEYLMFTSAWGNSFRTTTCDGTRAASGGPPVTESTTAVASAAVAASPCGSAVA